MRRAQDGIGDLSLRIGHALNQAGQSVGDAANVAGTRVHDWLVPASQALVDEIAATIMLQEYLARTT